MEEEARCSDRVEGQRRSETSPVKETHDADSRTNDCAQGGRQDTKVTRLDQPDWRTGDAFRYVTP